LSRIIKATYVRLDREPVQLENPQLVIEAEVAPEDADETTPQIEDEREKQIRELYENRLSRIQEMERALEETRLKQLTELEDEMASGREQILVERQQAEVELELLKEEELKNARAEGHAMGRSEGRQQAFDEAQAETEDIRRQAMQMLQEASAEARRRVMEGEQDLLEIALGIAAKILEGELSEREETTLQLIRQALANFKQVPQVILRVPQSRYPIVMDNLTKLKEEFRQVLSLDCLADSTLPLTDIVVDSPFGMMDVRFDAQLEILREALMTQLRENER